MNDDQLLRYARHLLLADMGAERQERLLAAHALVVGAGGLGCPAVLYLASAGLGRITVVDDDTVELSNLQRQIAHGMESLGQAKAVSLQNAANRINPEVVVKAHVQRIDSGTLPLWLPQASVVVDCSDNFATRHAINRACVAHGVPLVSGAAIQFDAQIGVYHPAAGGPCYACVFPDDTDHPETRCATLGVFAPLTGIVGAMQAAEAIKVVADIGTPLRGRLLMLDARTMEWSAIRTLRDPGCAVCGASHVSFTK